MREPCKNKNEYLEDGKRFVEQLKSCVCTSRAGDVYMVSCRLHQRGEKDYRYERDSDALVRDQGKKTLYLSPAAEQQVQEAVGAFDCFVESFSREHCLKAELPEPGKMLRFRRCCGWNYDYTLEYRNRSGEAEVSAGTNCPLSDLLREVDLVLSLFCCGSPEEREWITQDFERPAEAAYPAHPVYRAAAAAGDTYTEKLLKLCWNLATPEECRYLGSVMGERVLPALPKKYSKFYAVLREEIDWPLLGRSGYCASHVPYFAMPGSTHRLCHMNPCTRFIIDAAPETAEPVHFSEFLALFEEFETDPENKI